MSSGSPRFDRDAAILSETWILFCLSSLLIAIRSCGRYYTKNWGWDDTFIIIALVFMLIGAILVTLLIENGLGKHAADLTNPLMGSLAVLKYNVFLQMDTVICTFITKISISLYILRIKNDRKIRIILWVSMSFMFLATLATVIVVSLTCMPLEKLWTPSIKGKCLARSTAYSVAYVQSGVTIVTDLLLTFSPIAVLWNVRIERGKKIRICFLMSLGLVATLMNALRNYLQPELTQKDFTYAMCPIIAVIVLEHSLGVIAACIPACAPFLRLQKTYKSWHSLGGRVQHKSDSEEHVMDSVNLREIKSDRANTHYTGKSGHRTIIGELSDPMQSSTPDPDAFSKSEFDQMQRDWKDGYV